MLGRLRYLAEDLITGSLMLSAIGSQLTYSAILRLLTILEKKIFRICPDPGWGQGGGWGG